MDAAEFAADMAAAFDKAAWESVATGDTSAADAYWAARCLINDTFRKGAE